MKKRVAELTRVGCIYFFITWLVIRLMRREILRRCAATKNVSTPSFVLLK